MIKKDVMTDFDLNVFKELKGMALVTAGGKEGFNPMTVSWGSFGILWNEPCATLYIRDSRETLKYINKHDKLTIAFFSEEYKENLLLAGRISGRDFKDKYNEIGLTPIYDVDADIYYPKEAKYVMKLSVKYMDDLKKDKIDSRTLEKFYSDNDYHKIIICGINCFLVNEE